MLLVVGLTQCHGLMQEQEVASMAWESSAVEGSNQPKGLSNYF